MMGLVQRIIITHCRILLFEFGGGGWLERVPRESDMEGDTWSISRIQPSKEMEKNLSVTVSIICESMETKEDVVFFEEKKLNLTKS